MTNSPVNRPEAPEFPSGFAWWNTDRPLSLHGDLKGQVVVLDFWTFCCINCIHVLASLEQIEAHYQGQPLAIIGVHSNKFSNEARPMQVREAILRYRINHPVIVDEDHRLWKQYGVNAWPTLVFIDPLGGVVGAMSGELQPEQLQATLDPLLAEARQQGTLAEAPLVLRPEANVPSASGLAFPGKILTDPTESMLLIADSNHDRLLVTDLTGELIQVIGTGQRGQADGPLHEAEFHDPQGMAVDPDHSQLYVADHGNHLIRRVDLKARRVETVLGTGHQVFDLQGGRHGREQGLNSPWDLELVGHTLYIAMAGNHQIWRMNTITGVAEPWLGSGREDLLDGTGPNAALAQPSGLVHLDGYLYFVDSEISALRRANLKDGSVDTLIGHGLFDFGDADGPFGRARLQHPLGLTTDGLRLYVADTYNHKIKVVYLDERTIKTLAGTGQPGVGAPDGSTLELNEPGGLTWANERLYIADTNNLRIVSFDVIDHQWQELVVRPPKAQLVEEQAEHGYPVSAEVADAADALDLELEPALTEGFHLNAMAPQTVIIWEPEGDFDGTLLGEAQLQRTVDVENFPIRIMFPLPNEKPTGGDFIVDLTFASCNESDQKLCKPEHRRWHVHWRCVKGAPPKPIRLIGGAIGAE